MQKFPYTICGAEFPTEEALLAHVGEAHPGSAAVMLEFPKEVRDFASQEYKEWAGAEGLSEEEKRTKFGRNVFTRIYQIPSSSVSPPDSPWLSDATSSDV